MRITILHLDLGIGGAEQLIVNVATVCKELGHDVLLLTSHHDPNHCFEETKPNGSLGPYVHVYGDWLPRQLFGRFTAFFAIFRMIYLAFIVALFHSRTTDLVILDGVSAPIPILSWFGFKVLFYCHFPDMLLCYERSNLLKRCYRYVLDGIEEFTTGCADRVLVNSEFTAQVYADTFTQLAKRTRPDVLYPVIKHLPAGDIPASPKQLLELTPYCEGYDTIFLSLNRYERKKNIALALSALQHFKQLRQDQRVSATGSTSIEKVLLVVAGGYDVRVTENVEYLKELMAQCDALQLKYKFLEASTSCDGGSLLAEGVEVVFRISIPSTERTVLLLQSAGLLYTPDREHFGIVPIEAMDLGAPVIAVNSGGPKETVASGVTGYLCSQEGAEFGEAMLKLTAPGVRDKMSAAAKKRVKDKFSFDSMKTQLGNILNNMASSSKPKAE